MGTAFCEEISLAFANLRLRSELSQQAIRDPLTGLFNRRYMEEALARELKRAERHHTALSVLMIDLDHFKLLNDQFGHACGDAVLKGMGGTICGTRVTMILRAAMVEKRSSLCCRIRRWRAPWPRQTRSVRILRSWHR